MNRIVTVCLIVAAAAAVVFRQPQAAVILDSPLGKKKPGLESRLSEVGESNEKQTGYSRFAEFHRQLRTPDGKDSPGYEMGYQLKEAKKARSLPNSLRTLGTVLDWKSRGPGNIPGRTRSLLVMPNDASGNTWLAGSVGGGIWKTTDSGASWANLTPDLPNLAISALALCNSQPNVIYAGTGESFGNLDAIAGAGIFKSVDGGASWTQLPATITDASFRAVNRIIVDPNNPNLVVACSNTSTRIFSTATSGIFRSTDGGASWTKVHASAQPVQQVIAAPTDFSVQYAAVREVGVLKSVDAGLTWSSTAVDIKSGGRIELAVSSQNPLKVAASAEGSLSGEAGADLYLTENGGVSWVYVSEQDEKNFDFLQQGDYDNTIMFHPFNDNIVYVAGVSVFKFTVDAANPTGIKTIKAFDNEAASFIDFTSFSGNDLPGLALGDMPDDDLVDVEVRFGPGISQMAARFTVNKQGSGVPAEGYLYQNYVEVPFQAWDITNNKQLMVSFRDQQENGAFDLIASKTSGEGGTHSREYFFVHLVDYAGQADVNIAQNGGHEHRMLFNVWPVLATGQAWRPESLPVSKLTVSFSNLVRIKKQVTVVADGYGEHTYFSGGSVVNPSSSIHVDHHLLLASDLNQADSTFTIISANDGGVYKSARGKNPGAANGNWTFSGTGMVTGQFYGVDKRPGHDQYIGGLQDNSTNVSQPGASPGANAVYSRVIGGDGFDAVWNYANDRYVFGSAQFNTFFKSSEFGAPGTWSPAVSGLPSDAESKFPFFSRLGNSKSVPEILFCVGVDGVYRSLDFGDRWTLSQMDANWSYRGSFTNIEVSIANSMIVWAGGAMSSEQSLQVSTDRGKTFKKVANYTKNPELRGVVTGIATHPFEDQTAFVTFSYAGLPKVLRTKDLGVTWEDLSGFETSRTSTAGFPDVAVYDLLVLPSNPSTIWAGTEIGIFESLDDGKSWTPLQGFPAVSVWEMKVVDDQVLVATHGRGIYTAQLPNVPSIVMAPFIESLGVKPSGLVTIEASLRSEYDSTQVLVNGLPVKALGPNVAGLSLVNIFTEETESIEVALKAFKGGKSYLSISQEATADLLLPATEYASNFDELGVSNDFTGNGFSISKPIGFSSGAVHSRHKYDDDTTYIYKLRVPIIIDELKPTFKYRDIAIIEEGEAGSVFGDADFYDFVVVEGSKDGANWLPIADGYDAGFNSTWKAALTNAGQGTEALYVSHSINLLDTFQPGDTVIFRFRLFADQLENAWGWAFDDLKIQTESDNTVTDLANEEAGWQIYPNPVQDMLTINHPNDASAIYTISLSNIGGQVVFRGELPVTGGRGELDLRSVGRGIYILRIETANANKIYRLVKE